VLTLAFDTATDAASCALVRAQDVLGERPSRAGRILHDIDEVLAGAGVEPAELDGIVVGTGPGSYTGLRMGLVTARTLAFSLGIPVAGVSTLDALAAGSPGSRPVLDARRGEVFTLVAGEYRCLQPDDLELAPGETAVGDGAVRYRDLLEGSGALVPPDESLVHVPWARHHALLASNFGPPEAAEPIYLRAPDAERNLLA
jgi:tRNA threonylcarbamoyladenosine biosynthesis protein TsaB